MLRYIGPVAKAVFAEHGCVECLDYAANQLCDSIVSKQIPPADQREHRSGKSVERADFFFGHAIKIVRPEEASEIIVILALIPESVAVAKEEVLPSRLSRPLVHEERGKRRAAGTPGESTWIAIRFSIVS